MAEPPAPTIVPAVRASELIARARESVQADRHPAAVYLARLGAGSRPVMRQSLSVMADTLTAGATLETLPWDLLRYPHTQALRARLAERYAPATANRMLCALRAVLRECFRLELMSAEDYQRASDVRSVRGSRLPPGRALTAGEARALFGACARDTTLGVRDCALLAVLYGAGLRRSEVVSLRMDDFDRNALSLKVSGKGNKERAVPLARNVAVAIEAWIARRGDASGRLFLPVSRAGRVLAVDRRGVARTLTGQAVLVLVRRLAAKSGVARFSPHDTRRTFISELLDAGADLSVVQQLAGHAQVTTTARYDRRGEHARRRAVDLLHVPL